MKRDYFAKDEQKTRSGTMIIMDLKVNNLYSFKNFHINMSYPKKIVGSTIEAEYLEERTNFRYKKVNIIMGANASGKTTMGKLMMLFANYFTDGEMHRFANVVDDRTAPAELVVDFVTHENNLYRFNLYIAPEDKEGTRYVANSVVVYTSIKKNENYEICAARLDNGEGVEIDYKKIDTKGWHFSYPQDAIMNKTYVSIENNPKYLYVLENILKTLDPSIKDVIKVEEVENTYAIKFDNNSVIIKDGKINEPNILSSGTKAGLDISYIIASLICNMHDLYYCDELFSYVNSDIEKTCLSILIDKLEGRKQLFFTTHNSDILDMQLPKHSFTFLKKNVNDAETPIKCVGAADYLKRNTDSLKSAIENDLFCTAPEVDKLYYIAEL